MQPHYHPTATLRRLALLCIVTIFFSCNKKEKLLSVDPAFSKYIEAYTSGVVSKKNTIRIQLAEDANTTHTLNETLKEKYFDFKPSVNGKAYWVDARTIEFKPDNDLKPDKLYEVHFNLDKVLDVPKQFKDFGFNIQVLKPSFEVEEFGLTTNNKQTMNLSGELRTADVEDSKNVEKLLSAKLNNSDLKIHWQHNEADKTHQFTINNIQRSNKEEKLSLQWNGDALNADTKGEKEIPVPAIGDFKVMNTRAMQGEQQYALVQFSEPIAVGQMLDGLITIEGVSTTTDEETNVSYTINNSEVKVYTTENLDGNYTVNVHEGIENQWNTQLNKSFTSNVYFETSFPSVKIQGRGNILPNSSGKLILPFDATNLKAVDVSIIKIYENNIAQFLQTNNLNGEENLRRVGKPIAEATVRLDNDKTINLHKKTRFSLDLDKFIKTEPGAIYRVTIGFRPDYSLYTCDSITKENEEDYYDYDNDNNNEVDDDQNFWNRYDSYYPYGYNWQQRENPCFSSYYSKEKFASRNILASNIGLTAKRSSNGNLFVAANNIITTEPMKNVELEVLNYQLQIISKATTDADGIALLSPTRGAGGSFKSSPSTSPPSPTSPNKKPYLLIAKQQNERGYLKLDDGSSLPLSRFDVSGEEV